MLQVNTKTKAMSRKCDLVCGIFRPFFFSPSEKEKEHDSDILCVQGHETGQRLNTETVSSVYKKRKKQNAHTTDICKMVQQCYYLSVLFWLRQKNDNSTDTNRMNLLTETVPLSCVWNNSYSLCNTVVRDLRGDCLQTVSLLELWSGDMVFGQAPPSIQPA